VSELEGVMGMMEKNAELYLTIVDDLKKNNTLDASQIHDNSNINLEIDKEVEKDNNIKSNIEKPKPAIFTNLFTFISVIVVLITIAAIISIRKIYQRNKTNLINHEIHDKV